MTKMKRVTRAVGDYVRGFASEDGKNFRVERQNMDPVKKHVELLKQQVNEAPNIGNKNDWHYAGSIPMVVLTDWLKENGYSMHQWAVDEDNAKTKFMAHLKSNFPVFLADRQQKTFAVS